MIKILNLQEAKEWAEQNLYEADSFMFPLDVAVKRGLLKPINKEKFAIVDYETENGVVWHLDEIRRLSNKEMKEQDLYCRYRYKAHVISAPKGYSGATIISAGMMIKDEKDETLKAGTRVYIEGWTDELWILDYNCRVATDGTVDKTPGKYDKKVLVTLDSIDGEGQVCVGVRKSKVKVII